MRARWTRATALRHLVQMHGDLDQTWDQVFRPLALQHLLRRR
jgi:hypothetical protein